MVRAGRSTSRRLADRDDLAAFRTVAECGTDRSLTALIEREIIPRLMLAHTTGAPRLATTAGTAPITAAEIEDLAQFTLQAEADAVLAHVDAVLARGVAVDTVMVDLLAPAARLLGEYWEEDRCDFVDVTMALWRLQEIVHDVAARSPTGRGQGPGGHRALFASMPGDQHDFGTVVIDELFRREGWQTVRATAAETSELLRIVGGGWFDLVGLTVSCDCHIATLPSVLVALRNVSCNPRMCIMVGGRIFSADPALARDVGADGTAPDAKRALRIASDLVRVRREEGLVLN